MNITNNKKKIQTGARNNITALHRLIFSNKKKIKNKMAELIN